VTTSPTYGVTVLKVGQMDVPGPQVFWMSHWDEWLTLFFNVLLIEGDGVVMLVNTGPHTQLESLNKHVRSVLGPRATFVQTDEERIEAQLERRGLRPDDVTHVVVTPFTLYSSSGLPLFKSAQLCVSERGWIAFHTTHDHPHDARWATLSRDTLVYLVTDAWDRVRLLADEDSILPGIRTWWAGTHHRASIAIEIDTPVGVAVASDAFFFRENVLQNHPLGIAESIDQALSSYARVRATADHILPLNDPGLLSDYPGGVVAQAPRR
jgi:hypothetical protein